MAPAVLLIHGIWRSSRSFSTMRSALERAGHPCVSTIDFSPNDGSAGIPELAEQVHRHVQKLREKIPEGKIDVVGFSMGALVARYWIQMMDAHKDVRRFVSISGPHRGTATASLGRKKGIRHMRIGSPFIQRLSSIDDPWKGVEVFSFWTPYDLMIVPARSSQLQGAKTSRTFSVPLHHRMLRDPKVIDATIEVLLSNQNDQTKT